MSMPKVRYEGSIMKKKAAVVIGVDKTGNMTPLDSAARGAEEVAIWLKNEGFNVECLTDKNGPVTSQQIKDAIKKFVTVPARYHMLLIYFSGHGQWHARTDHWLLSGAPTDTSEAINLDGAMDLAKYSGIPNVVFISDACRSNPDSRTGAVVSGIDAFPNYQDFNILSDIDYFKATSESRSAFEGDIEGKANSVLTYALMSAFKTPSSDMIRNITEGGKTIDVVPNRKLKNYLQVKVNDILYQLTDNGNNLKQEVDINVPSDDDIYISRVLESVESNEMHSELTLPEDKSSILTIGQDAAKQIGQKLSLTRSQTDNLRDVSNLYNPKAEDEYRMRLPESNDDYIKYDTGFLVYGAEVDTVKTTKRKKDAWIKNEERNHNQPTIIVVSSNRPIASSVFIKLKDGRSVILAALYGYIGHAKFNEEGLYDVSYIPSRNNLLWEIYKRKKKKIDRLRALVAVAIEHNSFNLRSEEEAEALAHIIRMEKVIDPTLGLYAAYAFSQASKDWFIGSIMNYMQNDIDADLFDVRVLSSRIKDKPVASETVVPFCPMLTQTWNLLRPRGIELPDALKEAEAYLCNSLWTTFQPEATDIIIQAIEKGELL